jgi:hydrogenase-4 component F
MPLTGRGFLIAMLALMGLPPFGLFVSEVMIFTAGFQTGHLVASALGLALLVVAFAGLLRVTHRMLYGPTPARTLESAHWSATLALGAALLLLVLTGLAWPPGLAAALGQIASVLGP